MLFRYLEILNRSVKDKNNNLCRMNCEFISSFHILIIYIPTDLNKSIKGNEFTNEN